VLPAIAIAHERWVKHTYRPFDVGYFRSLSGEVLNYSLAAAGAIAGVIIGWYLIAAELADRLDLSTPEARAREARRPFPLRVVRALVRFGVDAEIDTPLFRLGQGAAAFVFARIPALVLALGVVQGWLVMPSFPLAGLGMEGEIVRGLEGALAIWILVGVAPHALGAILFAIFGYLIFRFSWASIDAVPVLASAFFYAFAMKGTPVNARQLAGIRVSLGIGFMLLGLVNKIWHAELFIGVGDNYPQLIEKSRHLIPHLSREAWSFTTALGEMSFGMLLLVGIFDKLTTIALSFIFTSFVFTFGFAEIVHLYPIAGFAVLFFRAPPGTALDGAVFRVHALLFRAFGQRSSRGIYALAVAIVAVLAAALLILGPLLFFVEILPRLA
jgi:hypothetical protein